MLYELLGKRVRQQRIAQGLTQEQLAEKAGISFAFVGHIERGTRKLSVATLFALAQALNCSADYLLDITHAKSNAYIHALQRVADFIQSELDQTGS